MGLTATFKKIETLSVDAAREWLAGKQGGEVTLLDVRQPQEYRSGHLAGAVFIPLPDLLDRAGEVDASKPVLVYCRSGNRSRSAAALLLTEGFSQVYSLEGGITAWNGVAATGDYREGLFLLEGRETAEELISVAWALEEGSRLFYEKAERVVSGPHAKGLFRDLTVAEAHHKETLLQAYRMVAREKSDETFLGTPPFDGIMEGGTQVEEVMTFLTERDRTLRDIVEVSMQVETNALDLYLKMNREIENEGARRAFASLIEEEKRHLWRLGELLGASAA